jgi:hypothetical protein
MIFLRAMGASKTLFCHVCTFIFHHHFLSFFISLNGAQTFSHAPSAIFSRLPSMPTQSCPQNHRRHLSQMHVSVTIRSQSRHG